MDESVKQHNARKTMGAGQDLPQNAKLISNDATIIDLPSRIVQKLRGLGLAELFGDGGPGHLWITDDQLRNSTREFLAIRRGLAPDDHIEQRALVDYFARVSQEWSDEKAIDDESRKVIESLYLTATRLNDHGLLFVARFENLRLLHIDSTLVENVSPLSRLKSLVELDLSKTQVADISPISGLSSLEELRLAETAIVDLSPLSNLTRLWRLDLSGTKIRDLAPLRNLKSILQLSLDATQIKSLAPLRGHNKLFGLGLKDTDVEDIRPIASCKGLHSLDLSGSRVSDISALRTLPNLTDLDLRGSLVTDLSPLHKLPALSFVTLPNGSVWFPGSNENPAQT